MLPRAPLHPLAAPVVCPGGRRPADDCRGDSPAHRTGPALRDDGRGDRLGRDAGLAQRAAQPAPHPRVVSSRHFAERDFLVYGTQRQTFAEHVSVAATLSRRLRELGVQPGDRVAIASRNLPGWVAAFWGIVASGAAAVPLNAWWTRDELEFGLTDSGAPFVDLERRDVLANAWGRLPDLRHVVVLPDVAAQNPAAAPSPAAPRIWTLDELLEPLDDELLDDAPPTPDDIATIFYTSGTTGRPKGAIGTHRNALTNMMNLFFISQRAALRYPEAMPPPDLPTATLLSIPLFHATGCLATMLVATAAGHKLVLMHHFDPADALSLIEREHITTIGGVPTVVMQLLDHPHLAETDISSVRLVSYGGAPAPPELVRRIRQTFRLAPPGNGYGLTEAAAAIAVNTGPDYVERPTSCGVPVPVCRAAIVPEGHGGSEPPPDVPPDTVGELWVQGPNVIPGYWNRPAETAEAITNGWLHTGDVARLDADGFLHIVDRAKDVIIRGGENVYSLHVETALFEHPDVEDRAVVGLPHPTFGEEVAIFVVVRAGRSLQAGDLRRHLAARLAHFEVPTRYFLRGVPLPRNPQGKLLKRQLRAEATSLSASTGTAGEDRPT
ncbi:MAG: class I adenylate-forming enzyme family protein [Acidimicrobiales bacterium]